MLVVGVWAKLRFEDEPFHHEYLRFAQSFHEGSFIYMSPAKMFTVSASYYQDLKVSSLLLCHF